MPYKHNNFLYFSRHVSTVHPSSSVVHILKSPLNLKRARSYKVRYIALSILRTKTKLNEWRLVLYRERVRLMCFTCWLRSGFSHFINMDSLSFNWYLVAAESRISKQSGVQDALQNSEPCRCLKMFEDLSESKCSRTRVEKCRLVSPT